MINELFPLLNIVDGWLAGLLPLSIRLSIWGALAGIVSITIYAKLSPQASIAKLKKNTRRLQREMLSIDLEFADFLSLSKENLKTSFRLFFTVLGPALVSAIPVIFLALWIHTCLAYEAPQETDDLVVTTQDKNIKLHLFAKTNEDEICKHNLENSKAIMVMADGKVIYSGTPLSPPTSVIHKKQWWNFLLSNPAGYIVDDAPIDNIRLNISRKQIIKWMPNWAAGWEIPFFVFVLIAAFGIKLGFRIE
jgi:hypothetical protein